MKDAYPNGTILLSQERDHTRDRAVQKDRGRWYVTGDEQSVEFPGKHIILYTPLP